MGEGEIGGIGHCGGFAETPAGYLGARAQHSPKTRSPKVDRVDLTAPEVAALRLLRERVLEHTRQQLQLQLTPAPAPIRVQESESTPEILVGRVLAEQAQLAAARRGTWTQERIEQALSEAMALAAGETLHILHELDQLEAGTWRVVCRAFDAWAEKVARAAGN